MKSLIERQTIDAAIFVMGVAKTYSSGQATVQALSDVNLSVNRGELVLLMGPSGSGKTTLLSIMGCILKPTKGSVRILGKETTSLGEAHLPRIRLNHIGFVFQSFNLFNSLTAGQNVELAVSLKPAPRSKCRHRAAELLNSVGLSEKYDTHPEDLSGGQKQRVAIARALALDPEIILADEPTAALDSQSGNMVMQTLSRLAHDHGRCVVIVTHDNRNVPFSDRILSIEDGRLMES